MLLELVRGDDVMLEELNIEDEEILELELELELLRTDNEDVPIVDELWTDELLDRVVDVNGVEDDDDSADEDVIFELDEMTELEETIELVEMTELDFDDVETGKDVLVALNVVDELPGRTVLGLIKLVS